MSTRFIAPFFTFIAALLLSFGAPLLMFIDTLTKHQLLSFMLIFPVVSALLGLYFGRAKPFFLSLLLLFWQLLFLFPSTFTLQKSMIIPALSVMVPLGFLFLGLLSERGIISKPGLLRLAIFVIIALASWGLMQQPDAIKAIKQPLIAHTFPISTSHLSLLLVLLSFLMLFLFGFLEKKQSAKILAWTLLCASLCFLLPSHAYSVLALPLASILFIISLINDAYKMAYIDTLTNIPSRRALEEYFTKLTPPYTVAMADIDHFKSFNDTYGHDTGDDVLRMVAMTLSKVEGGGKAFRYGGEEFTIVFAGKKAKEAKVYLEAIRETIAERGFALRQTPRPKGKDATQNRTKKKPEKTVNLTVSMGAADTTVSQSPEHIIKQADTLLYKAKKAGRNCLKI